jgi:DNA-binding transcriptional MerR regulator
MHYLIDQIFETASKKELYDKIDEVLQMSLDKQFVMKDVGLTSRLFNHWMAAGIIPNIPKAGDYRYEFSFLDLIWLHIVKELRVFGFPLNKIKVIYDQLMEPGPLLESIRQLSDDQKEQFINTIEQEPPENMDDEEKKGLVEFLKQELYHYENSQSGHYDLIISLLDLVVGGFLFYREETKFLIDHKGIVIPYFAHTPFGQIEELMEYAGFDKESYLTLSLMKFFRNFILKKENQDFIRSRNIVNDNEIYIMSLIREGKAKAITIKFDGQKPVMIEVTEEKKIFAASRLSETILKKQYQEIHIKTQDGNIAYANITTKKKLK